MRLPGLDAADGWTASPRLAPVFIPGLPGAKEILSYFSYAIWQAPLQDLNYATSTPV